MPQVTFLPPHIEELLDSEIVTEFNIQSLDQYRHCMSVYVLRFKEDRTWGYAISHFCDTCTKTVSFPDYCAEDNTCITKTVGMDTLLEATFITDVKGISLGPFGCEELRECVGEVCSELGGLGADMKFAELCAEYTARVVKKLQNPKYWNGFMRSIPSNDR
ncbi:hypothetical protein DL89DRAFT_257236 [Linderina pennispora]|uniref:Uncharacterized protein n=1 Tax=Linderina pennispora TaxID=61395 RepID=A0A1Y1W8T7_9FUNG|nr:uncharacterized protein DL89DRAFT_257236 [Linderina pennispora]ORX69937.1 hypothetical protein DL89DRAFT_257236 [Linderina pennispora]